MNMPPVFGFNMSFGLFSIFFVIISFFVFTVFAVVLIKGISTWSKNNSSPRLSVPATVITKRTNTTHHHNNMHHHSTHYYVTFQFESGDRLELALSGAEYGLIAEGDRGVLTFQGTRFLCFTRNT